MKHDVGEGEEFEEWYSTTMERKKIVCYVRNTHPYSTQLDTCV